MKNVSTVLLSALIACTAAACSADGVSDAGATAAATAVTTAAATTAPATDASSSAASFSAASDEIKEELAHMETVGFSGVAYAEQGGKPVAAYAHGTLSDGSLITIDTPLPVGSVSKQFCAASILLLQQQGKLSVNDTLDKYFPEYKHGAEITLHHMLCMRAGLPDFFTDSKEVQTLAKKITLDNTDEQNTAVIKEWVFSHEAPDKPGAVYTYNNVNYILLGNIVEQVSGKRYPDFLRESFFEPLGMAHTGTIHELKDKPAWAEAFRFETEELAGGIEPGLAKGAGDIVSTAADMTRWMNMLPAGTILSADSYRAMTANYNDGGYGYGLETELGDGFGHFGTIGEFQACDYFNTDRHITVFLAANTGGNSFLNGQFSRLTDVLKA